MPVSIILPDEGHHHIDKERLKQRQRNDGVIHLEKPQPRSSRIQLWSQVSAVQLMPHLQGVRAPNVLQKSFQP